MVRLRERGDTIVEVLIAILVVSTIMSGAFVSARKSQTAIRSSQERVEALKVAEGQAERVKAAATSGTPNVFTGTDAISTANTETFCIDSNNIKRPIELKPLDADDSVGYDANCKSTPTGVEYRILTERDTTTNTFIVHTRWDGINGTGKQEVKLAVRIDP